VALDTVTIHRAQPGDLDAVLDLVLKQFLAHAIDLGADQLEAAITQLLARPELGFVLVAKKGNSSVGLAVISFAWTLEHGGKSAWLDELFVLPHHRGAGIGTVLVERAMAEAQKDGCRALDLEVEVEHTRAERVYERMGFEQLERRRWVRVLGS
jgi:GNAT superfamily N-acetyltransferase